MILRQFLHTDPVAISYLFGCGGKAVPGAYSGSVCGRALSGKPSSTVGFEKRHNRAFRIADEEAFVASMLADIPPPPPGARELRASNAGWIAS